MKLIRYTNIEGGDWMEASLTAVQPEGGNVVFKADGCFDLPAKKYEDSGLTIIETVWELSEEQLKHISEQKKIRVSVIGNSIQPISVEVI